MAMGKAHESIKSVITQWDELRKTYPDELDFSSYGFEGVQAPDFDIMFAKWEKLLEVLSRNESYDSNPETHAIDSYAEKILDQIKVVIEASKAKGFADLLNGPFLQWVSEIHLLISSVAEIRLTLQNDLAQSARVKVTKDVMSINAAAAEIKKLIKLNLPNKAKNIEAALNNATRDLQKIGAFKTEADELQKLIDDYRNGLTTTKTEVDTIIENIRGVNKSSSETLDSINAQKQALEAEIAKSTDSVKQANDKISKALEDISRQGLAGSFAAQADKIRFERRIWLAAFALTIISLMVFASFTVYGPAMHHMFSYFTTSNNPTKAATKEPTKEVKVSVPTFSSSTTSTDTNWWKDLLHELPFAAPLIWFGWFSARQIGTLSKIQQDYNYKASTAVAFEGYKKEVEVVQDEALSKQLLETVIRNFGDNPIRLYSGNDDHGMPIEALLAKIFDDKTFNKWLPQLQKICESISKCFNRSSN